jgi:HSP20 family molecular chaperone IbpA
MAFFPIRRYRVLDDPFDRYFGDQLDLFDPWRDFDTFPTALAIRPNAFRWVTQPSRSTPSSSNTPNGRAFQPSALHAEKFRVQLNVAGFNPETIKTKVEGRKIIVEAKQEDRQPDGDFSTREIRKSYELPEHADATQLASYVTPNNMLVIEAPIHNPETERRRAQTTNENQNLTQFGQYRDPLFDYLGFLGGSDFQSRIVDKGNNQKQLEMNVGMKNYRPEEINVSVKNNELIVQGEYKHKDENRSERSFFFKSTTLPPGTQVDQLQTHLTDDGQLKIEAPFIEQKEATKSIPEQKETTKSIPEQKEPAKSIPEQKK